MAIEHSDRAHAKLSASGSAMWLNCPGSVKANQGLSDKGSVFAAEGTAAHELSELCLQANTNPDAYLGDTVSGFEVTHEMADNVSAYVDYVRSISGEHFYEYRVDFSPWVAGGFGTADVIVLSDNHLHCIDLKYGRGVQVDAENNTQGMLYALGCINDFSHFHDFEQVTIHIFQPRIGNYSDWTISVTELLKWADWVKERADLALSDNAPRNPSEKACRWCKAKGDCKALADYTTKLITAEFDDLTPSCDVDKLTEDQLADVLAHKGLIVEWINAVEALVVSKLEQGEKVPGYKLVAGRSIRKWSDSAESTLTDKLGEQAYSKKLIGIGEAEKLLGKKELAQLDVTIKPEGKPTLVPESDKRKPIEKIADLF